MKGTNHDVIQVTMAYWGGVRLRQWSRMHTARIYSVQTWVCVVQKRSIA